MGAKDYFWKVWLRPNLLTQDVENDYIAEVSTEKNTLRNEDIAKRIVASGSEIQYDTLLSIFNQHDRIIRESIQQGYRVLTGVCQYTPRITGNWIGSTPVYNPSIHRKTLDIVPSSQMREALTHVGVEILGKKSAGAVVGLVTDISTGRTDGFLTANDDIKIEGEKIKVDGTHESIGVYFVDMVTSERHKVTHRLTQNDPRCVIARVPADLKKGTYALEIVTQYTQGLFLKEPRTIEYSPLQLGDAESGDDIL